MSYQASTSSGDGLVKVGMYGRCACIPPPPPHNLTFFIYLPFFLLVGDSAAESSDTLQESGQGIGGAGR